MNDDISASDNIDAMDSWLQVDIGQVDEVDDDDIDEESQSFLSPDFEIGTAPSDSAMDSPRFRDLPLHESYFSQLHAHKQENEGKYRATEFIDSPTSSAFSEGKIDLSARLDRMDAKDAWTTVANLSVGKSKRKMGRSADIPVELYEHDVTGLRVCFVDSHGPLVSTYFCIATESVSTEHWQKDDGIPHILEHLTTFGCEKYPFRNVLDQLSCRCVSQQTDAWTETDHSAYVLKTLGEDSFFTLLPIYMDHILEPLLGEEAFLSEVCHLNHNGEHSGLIYDEVKSRENYCEDMCLSALLQKLFPDENGGYSSMPSGRSTNIRSLKIESVRKFHQHFYILQNMQVIVSGSVDKQKVLEELHRYSMLSFLKKQQRDGSATTGLAFERPWSKPMSVPAESTSIAIDFPVEKTYGSSNGSAIIDDEQCGMVLIGWRGPEWSNFEDILKIRLMWKYLINSPSSPLKKIFLGENENSGRQLCRHISVVFTPQSVCCHHVRFHGVPVSLLHTIAPIFFHAIAAICKTTCYGANVAVHSPRLNESSSHSLSHSLNREAMESSSVSSEQQKSHNAWCSRGDNQTKTIAPEIRPHVVPTSTFFSKLCAKEKQQINPNPNGVTSLEGVCNRDAFKDSFGLRHCQNVKRLRAIETIISNDMAFVGGVDMKQISTIIANEKMRQKMIWEDDRVHSNVQTPHLIGKIISQFLYGDRFCKAIEMQQLGDFLNGHEMLDTLPQSCDANSKHAWEQLMFDYLLREINPKFGSGPVCVIGRPSTEIFQKQVQQESARFEENCKVYDIPGEMQLLKRACSYLANEKHFLPAKTLYEMPLHSPTGAKYFPITSIRSTPNYEDEVDGGHTSISLLTKGTPADVEDENLSDVSVELLSGDEILALFYSKGLVQEGGVGPRNHQLPFLIQWSQIPSHFVDICVAIETSCLPAYLRPYLQLFTETLLESHVLLDDGSRLHAANAKELRSEHLVSTYCKLGIGGNLQACGEFAQAIVLTFRVEQENYEQGVEWLRRTLFHMDLASDARILEHGCHQILKAVAACQSDGLSLCMQLVQSELFDNDKCNHCASSILTQNVFIRQVLRCLEPHLNESKMSSSVRSVSSSISDLSLSEDHNEMNVFRDMKCVQEALMVPSNFKILVVGDVVSQEDPVRPWLRGFLPPESNSSFAKQCFPANGPMDSTISNHQTSMIRSLIFPTSSLTSKQAHNKSEFHSVISVPFLDHSAMVQVAPGPKSFDDHSLPALLVAIDVVTAQASHIHNDSFFTSNHFRSAVITCRPEQGLVFLQITEKDKIHEFYQTLYGIVCALVERENPAISMLDLDSSRVSIANELAETEETLLLTMFQHTSGFIRGTTSDYLKVMTKNILELSVLEIREAARTYLLPLFTPIARTAIAVCPEKTIEVQEAFSKLPSPLNAKLSLNTTIHPEAFMPIPHLSKNISPVGSSEFGSKDSRRHLLMAGSAIVPSSSHHALAMLPSPPSICSDSESNCSSLDVPRSSDGEALPEVVGRRRHSTEDSESGQEPNLGAAGTFSTVGLESDSIGGKAVGLGMMAIGAAVAFTAFAVQASSNNNAR